jgi:sortase A
MAAIAGVDLDAGPGTEPRPIPVHRRPGFVFRFLGIACLLAAMGVGGHYAWLMWGTGLSTARAQAELRTVLEERIDGGSVDSESGGYGTSPADGAAFAASFRPGDPVAIIQIPRIGLDMVVVEGTASEPLTKGPGHYPDSAFPWEDHGRVAIAGHRTTYLRPFWSLDRLRKGDLIRLVTERGTFDYRVFGMRKVLPGATWVVHQTASPSLVLTTCTPRFWASHRLVVFASR